MQAVILAAGKGTRMMPLTMDLPKPLVKIQNKPILAHIIDCLPNQIQEILLIVGYKGEMIKQHFGTSYNGKKIRYIMQHDQLGTFRALEMAKSYLHPDKPFLVLNADDLHGAEDLKKCLAHPRAMLVARAANPSQFGVIECDESGKAICIEEKPDLPKSNLVSTGVFLLDHHIFSFEPPPGPKGELYLATAVAELLEHHPVYVVESDFWFPIATPEDVLAVEKELYTGDTPKIAN